MRRIASTFAILVTVLFAQSCGKRTEHRRAREGAPVILISIDTLRADHLPAYGYPDLQTPNIDALRKDGVLFANAYSQVPLTLPSHASILTGVFPADNGVRNNIGYRLEDPNRPSIPKSLKASGYATGAAISSYVLRSSTGLGALFDSYDDLILSKPGEPIGSLQRSGYTTEEIAQAWVAQHANEKFFYLFHLFEPHAPYEPPEPFRSRYRNPYDGEIATADDVVGRFIASLKQSGVYDRAVIILISDHGEGLYEHGEPEHGLFLYREDLHVPLIIKLPDNDRAGETVDRPVALVDIFPTITGLVGVPTPEHLAGRSLLADAKPGEARNIFSETLYPRIHLGWSELRSLIGTDYHYIEAPTPELYAFRSDPEERKNVLPDERRTYASFKKEMDGYSHDVTAPGRIDPEDAAKLSALGYLGSTQTAASGPLPDPKDHVAQIAAMMDAMGLQRSGRVPEAILKLKEILRENPRFSDAWNELALSYESLGDYEAAAAAYRKAIELSPALAGEFGLSLGSMLLHLDRYDEAAAHAKLGEKVNPSGAHTLLARIHLAKKEFAAAETEARIAMQIGYSKVPASVLLIQIYAQEGKIDDALALIGEVSAEIEAKHLGPVESFDAARGDVLARAGRQPEAVEAFRREIENFPRNQMAYGSLAVIYFLGGDPAGARSLMEQLVKANPGKRSLLFAAHTLEQLNDPSAAADFRRRAASVRG